MNFRVALIIGCSTICALTATGVVLQQREISELRRQHRKLLNQANTAPRISPSSVDEQPKATPSPSIELLRLRSEVNRLMIRRHELDGIPKENEFLREEFAVSRMDSATLALRGYIQKSTARNLGYSTPEATLETMLWAMQNNDTAAFLQSYMSSADAKAFEKQPWSDQFRNSYSKHLETKWPFIRIVGRKQLSPERVNLKVEIGGYGKGEFQFRLLDGQWKWEPH